jgi:hypothetical protein
VIVTLEWSGQEPGADVPQVQPAVVVLVTTCCGQYEHITMAGE